MVGPFDNSSMYSFHISPMPVVLNTDGGLAYVHASILSTVHQCESQKRSYSHNYFNIVFKQKAKAIIAKCDIMSIFRLFRVYTGDFELLGLYFVGSYYVDKFLPRGKSRHFFNILL